MRWIFLLPLFLFGYTISEDLGLGLRALQQIRSLIPERLSVEEFSIVVDQKGFDEVLNRFGGSFPAEAYLQKTCSSRFFYSQWTFSGEPIRILDSYEEFEYGPYWLYPTALHRLEDMYPQPNSIHLP